MNTQTTIESLIETLAAKHNMEASLLESMDEQALWLCSAIDANPADCTAEKHDFYGLTVYTVDGKEYAVGNDSEADDAWDKSLDSYLEDCVYPELKGTVAENYFDDEKWKRDAKFDGRGHSLSSYDRNEIELGGEFYAYRTN